MFTFPRSLPFVFKGKRSFDKIMGKAEKNPDDSESEDSFLDEHEIRALRSKRSFTKKWLTLFLVAHLVIFAIYAGTVIHLLGELKSLRKYGLQLMMSPANEAMEWEERHYDENSQSHGPFSGFPRPEINKNWHDLINAENIILEPEIVAHLGREDIAVADPDGRGYIGTLNVYHELHCIKRLWQYTYPDTYAQNQTAAQKEGDRLHKEHCFDFLRQSAMCHADVGLITYQWSDTSRIPIANSTTHQCANWKKLDEWTKKRTVDMMKPGWLIHPSKGPAYDADSEWH